MQLLIVISKKNRNKMKIFAKTFLLVSLLIASCDAWGQTKNNGRNKFKIEGNVIDGETNTPLEFAIIRLFRSADSSVVVGAASENNGGFSIFLEKGGNYFMKINSVGYKDKILSPLLISDSLLNIQLGTIKIYSSSIDLKSVEIVAEDESEKSAYQIDIDKKVYSVSKDIVSSNGTAGDVLQNIPSVFVTQDGDVSLRGGNVKIYINGRPSGLMGISRDQILDYIPASMIESIEIISNPSSRYDAEGGSGIINIILKKQRKPGFNGYIIGSAGTQDKYNGSLNLNFNKGKLNVFGSYDVKSYNMESFEIKNRESRPLGKLKHTNQNRNWFRKNISQNERINVEYQINAKNTLATSLLNSHSIGNYSGVIHYELYDSLMNPTSKYDRQIDEQNIDNSTDYTLNYTRKFKRSQQLFTSDFSFSNSSETTTGDIVQRYYNLNFTPSIKAPGLIKTGNLNTRKSYVWQTDYVQPIGKKTKIELGLKSRNSLTKNNYSLDNFFYPLGIYVRDSTISNGIKYSEVINSAYVAYRRKLKKLGFKVGVRAEHTLTDFNQFNDKINVHRNYINLFPSTHLSYEINKKHNFTFSYSRRIDRPSLSQINSLQKYNDPQFLFKGNPNLIPEITNSFDFSHILNWKRNSISSSIYYRKGDNSIQRITQLNTEGVTITTYKNLVSTQNLGSEFYAFLHFSKVFRISSSLNIYQNVIDATNLGSAYHSNRSSWNGKVNLYFIPWKYANFQITANYQARSYTPFVNTYDQFFADCSFRQDFWKKKMSVSIRCSDLLWTQRKITEAFDYNYFIFDKYRKQSRIVFLSLTFRPFGMNKKLKEMNKEQDMYQDDKDSDK